MRKKKKFFQKRNLQKKKIRQLDFAEIEKHELTQWVNDRAREARAKKSEKQRSDAFQQWLLTAAIIRAKAVLRKRWRCKTQTTSQAKIAQANFLPAHASKTTRHQKKTKHATSLALSCFKSSRHISKSHTTIRTDAPAPALRRQAPAPVHTRVCRHTGARTCAYHTRVRKHTYTHAHACIREKKKDTRMCTRVTHVCASTRTQAHARVHTRKKRGACVRAHHTSTCTRITKTKKTHVRALTRARVRKKTRKIFHRRVRSRARAYEKKSEKYFSSTCVHACVCVCDVCVCVGVCVGAQARMKKKKKIKIITHAHA